MFYDFAIKYLKDEFGLELNIPIEINSRLTRALGRFRYRRRGKQLEARCIELSKDLLSHYNKETILAVLKHELVHYALFELGLPHDDSSSNFKAACISRGVPLQHQIKACGKVHYYECPKCGKQYKTNVRKLRRDRCFVCDCKTYVTPEHFVKTETVKEN
jgi:SprT-like protein